MEKEEDLKYIKDFSKITVSSICRDLGINRQNLLNGRASTKNTKKVRKKIEEKLKHIEREFEEWEK